MEFMDIDEQDVTIPVTVSSKPRKAPSNVRHENKENRMTRLGKTNIYYSDDLIIGNGATSLVYEGYFQSPNKPAAIKRVWGRFADISNVEMDTWQKIGTTTCPENVNVVQLLDYKKFREGNEINYYFAMELAKASLKETIKKMRDELDPLWKQKTIGYLEDAAKGLSWLHKMRVVHRDIKPDNFLVFDVNQRDICKIGDFGISKNLKEMSTGTNSMGRGTSDWMSPEAIKSMKFGNEVNTQRSLDIFSFGLVAHYAMTQGVHPFELSETHGKDRTQNIFDDKIKPNRLDERGLNPADHLFRWAMSKEPKDRPKIDQVLQHPFFWSAAKSLEFIRDFARSVDSKSEPLVNNLRNNIDQEYKKFVKLQNMGMGEFDWKAKLDNKVVECLFHKMKGKKGMQLKSYDGTSLLSLVELLRDKDMHHTDLNRELIDLYFGEEFGESGEFCYSADKFVNYFLQLNPDLIIFIWIYLVTDVPSQKYTFLSSMRHRHKLDCFPKNMPKFDGVMEFINTLGRNKIPKIARKL